MLAYYKHEPVKGFKLKDFTNASNQSVPFKPLNRFVKRIRDLFSKGKTCNYCHTKIKSYTLGSARSCLQKLFNEQCYIICLKCKKQVHFLCYMEAIGAAKGDGAIFRWPSDREQLSSYNLAPCPKCKSPKACYVSLNGGGKIFFNNNEIVSFDLTKYNRKVGSNL